MENLTNDYLTVGKQLFETHVSKDWAGWNSYHPNGSTNYVLH